MTHSSFISLVFLSFFFPIRELQTLPLCTQSTVLLFYEYHGCDKGGGDLCQQVDIDSLFYEGAFTGLTHGISSVTRNGIAHSFIFPMQTPIVSLASTQSTLLSYQVYLTDRIDNKKRDRMPHMKCVCFLQNSESSMEALEAELREPKYGEYYLCQLVNHTEWYPVCELSLTIDPQTSVMF